MPGGNGMGPLGLGPLTGRGRGYCANSNTLNARSRGGYNTWGRHLRGGRGFGFYNSVAQISPEEEASMLKSEADFLRKKH